MIRALQRTNTIDAYFRFRRAARGRIAETRDRIGAPSHLRPGLATPGVVAHRAGRTWWAAVVEERITFEVARDRNLRILVTLLDDAAVPYFFVPIGDPRQYRIGVDLKHRDHIADLLGSRPFAEPTYVRPSGFPTRRLRPLVGTACRSHHDAQLRASEQWWVWVPYTDPSNRAMIGIAASCQLEFWSEREADRTREDPAPPLPDAPEPPRLRSRRRNEVADTIDPSSIADAEVRVGDIRVPTVPDFARYHAGSQVGFPIDLVYTWVDDSDPDWQRRRVEASGIVSHDATIDGSISARYRNRNELLYSLRSVAMYVPFARHIYVVTDRQRPDWLDERAPGLTVVDHTEIFGPDDVLPTFNSHAIESRLHRIPGLSEHYLYVNDDVFFARLVQPMTFFTPFGLSRYFPSRTRIPVGPPSPSDPTVTMATKNGRDLLFAEHGTFPTRKMKHTPHPQRRSTVEDLERRFPAAMAQVARNRFRSTTDIPVASWLQHYHGEAIGNAIEGVIRYNYINLGVDNLADRLDQLLPGNFEVWCLNDVGVRSESDEVDRVLFEFLERAFPWPSPWERAGSSTPDRPGARGG